ncbi:ankyrin repeat domain-containing protein 36C-like [Myotis daubentonii]|uniref:ankyrin repeat domain-containing protein 36C-like n=1 Tax=Myotis daubentonii TaxID=98922 RepID=UPI002873989F|nr:ankyrin repeat domain-containing protein 36C-like [Myotis daubentonii]
MGHAAAAADSGGWSQKSKVEQTDKQQLPIMESEDSDRYIKMEDGPLMIFAFLPGLYSVAQYDLPVCLQKTRKHAPTERKSRTVLDTSEEDSLIRFCSKLGIDDSRPTSHNEDLKAILHDQEECAAILLDHGADPNVMDIHGNTPLHYAVLGKNTAIVEKLLSCMANPEARNKDDFTPLSLAKYENNEKMVEFLLTRDSEVHQMEGHALKVACYKGHKRVVSQLARRRRLLDLCDTENKTALIHAIQYEQEECAAILLEHGADPNVIDIHGNTALHYAVLSENTTIVEKLVSCMANLEVRNKDDFTPLSLAKHENKEKMVEFLVTRGLKDHQVEGNQQSTNENKEERSPMKSSDSNNLGKTSDSELLLLALP